jgi:hypothetical protein
MPLSAASLWVEDSRDYSLLTEADHITIAVKDVVADHGILWYMELLDFTLCESCHCSPGGPKLVLKYLSA